MDSKTLFDACNYCPYASDCCANKGSLKALTKRVVTFDKGDTLIQQGEQYDGFYVMCQGSAKATLKEGASSERILEFYHPRDLIGLSGFSNAHYQESVNVMAYTKVLKIEKDDFEQALHASPVLASEMLSVISERLVKRQHHYSAINTMEAETRLIHFLYEEYSGTYPEQHTFELSMTRLDIANYLGIAVETLSRLMKRLSNKGIIETNHRTIAFRDPADKVLFDA